MQLAACALFVERRGPETFYGPREQVFLANFEEVWRAVNLVVQPYPLRVSNMDQGVLETDMIRGYRIWSPPHGDDVAPSGETYRLVIRVIKGIRDERSATKVTVVKDTQLQVDFFSDPKSLPSDGLEERSILYRVGREIQIDRALARAQKKQNQQQNNNSSN
ncbi:MAG: hypothetical protein AB7P49_19020 [Bdellovibrionales bacterium]